MRGRTLLHAAKEAKSAGYADVLRNILNEFTLGEESLASVLDPVINTCEQLAKSRSDFVACIREVADTLKESVRKVK